MATKFTPYFLCFCLKGNLNQPTGYSVPMVTQAPPIQPLPVRPGVIAQVRQPNVALPYRNHGYVPISDYIASLIALLCPYSRHGLAGDNSSSFLLLGSR